MKRPMIRCDARSMSVDIAGGIGPLNFITARRRVGSADKRLDSVRSTQGAVACSSLNDEIGRMLRLPN